MFVITRAKRDHARTFLIEMIIDHRGLVQDREASLAAGLSRPGETFSLVDHRPHPGNLTRWCWILVGLQYLSTICSQIILKRVINISSTHERTCILPGTLSSTLDDYDEHLTTLSSQIAGWSSTRHVKASSGVLSLSRSAVRGNQTIKSKRAVV